MDDETLLNELDFLRGQIDALSAVLASLIRILPPQKARPDQVVEGLLIVGERARASTGMHKQGMQAVVNVLSGAFVEPFDDEVD